MALEKKSFWSGMLVSSAITAVTGTVAALYADHAYKKMKKEEERKTKELGDNLVLHVEKVRSMAKAKGSDMVIFDAYIDKLIDNTAKLYDEENPEKRKVLQEENVELKKRIADMM